MARPDHIRLSFNEAAEIYDRVRPSYPGELFEALFDLLPDAPEIIEVGPRSGQATRDLLDRGALVHAIEIGPAMAARLGANCKVHRVPVPGCLEYLVEVLWLMRCLWQGPAVPLPD